MLAVINYHYIRNDFNAKHPSIFGLTPQQLRNQLLELGKHGNFIGQHDLKAAIKENKPLPARAILLTFDDGLAEQYNLALPILEELNIPAVFFICSRTVQEPTILNVHKIHLLRSELEPRFFMEKLVSHLNNVHPGIDVAAASAKGVAHYKYDTEVAATTKYLLNFEMSLHDQNCFIEQLFAEVYPNNEEGIFNKLYMNLEQVNGLAHRGWLGSHGHDHLPVGLLNEGERKVQLSGSKKILENITGEEIYGFSFPYGAYEACNVPAENLSEAGYEYAVTLETALNIDLLNPFYLSRLDCNDAPAGKNFLFKNNDLFTNYLSPKWDFNNL